jgi:hypothetical protein
MSNLLRRLFARKSTRTQARSARKAHLGLEALEERQVPSTLTPIQVRQAYGFDRVGFLDANHPLQIGDGRGTTIAIVDAYDDPNIKSDLATFDSNYGLPAANLTVVNQSGGSTLPGSDPGQGTPGTTGYRAPRSWETETALDVEYAHAVAPGAKILLVETNDSTNTNLYAGVKYAANQSGVVAVSMSWGAVNSVTTQFGTTTSEYNGTSLDSTFSQNGVTYVAATGDNGAPANYPAFSPKVVAVGGTSVSYSLLTGYSETGWSGSGGGISQYESQPSYQSGVVTQSTTQRCIPDVAFVAATVTIYDTYAGNGFYAVNGTSIATPIMAGLVSIVDQGLDYLNFGNIGISYNSPSFLNAMYHLPDNAFNDITTGSNGTYSCGTGYDLVTGRGTPNVPRFVAGMIGDPVLDPTSNTLVVCGGGRNSSDTISLNTFGSQLEISWNIGSSVPTNGHGSSYSEFFTPGTFSSIEIDTVSGTGYSTVNIGSTFSAPISVLSYSSDAVNIGMGNTSGVLAPISLSNATGKTTDLTIDDSGEFTTRTVTLDEQLVGFGRLSPVVYGTIDGLTQSTVSYLEGGIGNLVLKTGTQSATVNVAAVKANALDLQANSSSGYLTEVNLGSSGTLANINAPVYMWAASGKIYLTVNDANDGANHTGATLGLATLRSWFAPFPSGSYSYISGLAPEPIYYRSGDMDDALNQIVLGTGTNDVTVTGTVVRTELTANSNATAINVGGGSLDQLLGQFLIEATPGKQVDLAVDDSQSPATTNRTLTLARPFELGQFQPGVGVQGGGAAFFNSAAIRSLTVHAGSGDTMINVDATLPGIVTTIDSPLRTTGSTQVNVHATTGPLDIGLFGPEDGVTLGSTANTLDSIQGPVAIGGGDPAAFINQFSVTVNDAGSNTQRTYTLTANGLTRPGAAAISFTTSLYHLNLGARADEVDVQGTPGGTTLFENGDAYTVNVGTPDGVLSNLGGLTVYGQALINLNDQGATDPQTYTFGRLIFHNFTTTGTTVNYNSTQVQGVVLNGGSGGNTINVQETQAVTPVTINAGAGVNTIVLGEQNTFLHTDYSLSNILGPVTINGSGADTLNANDQGTRTDRTYILDGASISWGGVAVSYNGVASVALNGGAGSNVYYVEGTLAGTSTALTGGAGFNEFVVSDANETLNSLQGALALHGQPGSNSFVVLDDAANPAGQTYTFTAGQVSGTGMGPISYDGLNEVVLYTAAVGGNTVNVQGNADGVFLNLAVGSGDTVYLGEPLNDGSCTATLADVAGTVLVNAPSFSPTVIVDNSAAMAAQNVTVGQDGNEVYLDGLAAGRLAFNLNPGTQVQVKPGSGFTLNGSDVLSFALGTLQGTNQVFALTADGTLYGSTDAGWVVEDSGVQSFALGSLGGINYLMDLESNGNLLATSGNGWQLEDTGVLDMTFQNIGGTNYLTGDDGNGPFQWSMLPV